MFYSSPYQKKRDLQNGKRELDEMVFLFSLYLQARKLISRFPLHFLCPRFLLCENFPGVKPGKEWRPGISKSRFSLLSASHGQTREVGERKLRPEGTREIRFTSPWERKNGKKLFLFTLSLSSLHANTPHVKYKYDESWTDIWAWSAVFEAFFVADFSVGKRFSRVVE